jgi:two-component system response regulator NreC
MNTLRIFLADDHIVLREGLKSLINAQPDLEVVGEAGNGQEALQKVQDLHPDVVLMDLSMPEMNGLRATEHLKQLCPQVKVLALTALEDQDYFRQLLKMGASGYLLKHAAAEELIQAIRRVAAGGIYLDPSLAGAVVDNYIREPSSTATGRESDLSDRETEVLRLIAWGYTNKEIAAQLHISTKTVETHKTNLMSKLDLSSRADIVRYASRRGWLREA